MLQLLHIVPADELAIGDRVRVSEGSYLTVARVDHDEIGVRVSFGGPNGHGLAVLYPANERVGIVEYALEEQIRTIP